MGQDYEPCMFQATPPGQAAADQDATHKEKESTAQGPQPGTCRRSHVLEASGASPQGPTSLADCCVQTNASAGGFLLAFAATCHLGAPLTMQLLKCCCSQRVLKWETKATNSAGAREHDQVSGGLRPRRGDPIKACKMHRKLQKAFTQQGPFMSKRGGCTGTAAAQPAFTRPGRAPHSQSTAQG